MTIEFPDLSHHNTGVTITAGTPVVIAKVTQDVDFADDSFAGFKVASKAVGAVFAGYHWVGPGDPAAQARWAYAHAGPTVPLMWDAEGAGATVPRILALTAAYRSLGGTASLAYLPRWWWEDHLGSPDLRPLQAAGLGLVSSNYPAAGYSDNGAGWAPYGGVTPVQWQWTDAKAYGGKPKIDFNAYRGTIEQYRALLFGRPVPARGDDEMRVYRVTTTGAVWVSNGPQCWHVPAPDTYNRLLKVWGLTSADVIPIEPADVASLGQDVSLSIALPPLPGPPGPATLVPHDHGVSVTGTTGAAVPTDA